MHTKEKRAYRRVALFSMMIVALLIRPWIILAECMGAAPKVLADDVRIIVKGPYMLGLFAKPLNTTHIPTIFWSKKSTYEKQ